jgi:CBS domain-containing protein
MRVADIMTRDVVVAAPVTTVSEIARLMWHHNLSGLPIVDAGGRVVGIVTEMDLLARNANLHVPTYLRVLDVMIPLGNRHEFEEELRRAVGTTAHDVMSPDVVIVAPDTDLADAATLMMDKRIKRLPVVENGKLVGIITAADFLRLLAQDIPTES